MTGEDVSMTGEDVSMTGEDVDPGGAARTRCRDWLRAEPDADVRDELQALLNGDEATLVERFDGRLSFGTAGLRAPIGAGPRRMNRLVVRQAAAGIVDVMLREIPDSARSGILIGYDARFKSRDFAFDTARVAAARGMRAIITERPLPTPVLAWNITRLGTAGGIMVTASHNPASDNGYKVYLASGAQIVPPWDERITAAIETIDPLSVELAAPTSPLITVVGDDLRDAYVDHVPRARLRTGQIDVRVAYTAMHGVGGDVAERAFQVAGITAVTTVSAQQEPDPRFPTVSFPNPEEPGAMDMVIELAQHIGADVALAHDPDADRLGVAIPTGSVIDGRNGWRLLSGDEIGWLLADHILQNTRGADRLVVTTLVSSSLLEKMAAASGVHFTETYTGFKWIADAINRRPDLRVVFAYEQALGYLVTDRPLDKDGITAAVVMAELVSTLKQDGQSVEQRLAEIGARFGRHVTAETSVRMEPTRGARAVQRMRMNPPREIRGRQVVGVEEFPEAGLLRVWVAGASGGQGGERVRLQVRPSGTEPKVKMYGEAIGEDPLPLLGALADHLAEASGQP